jgi:outer membrane protein OmpA-like peptidoglycan-associated protein
MTDYQTAWAEAQSRRDRLHRWGAIVLAILLLLLWLLGRGPSTAGCCGPAGGVPPPAVAPAPVLPAPPPAPAAVVAPAPAAVPLAKVYFSVDQFAPPADVNLTLKPIVEYLNANPGTQALISGFHDPTGNREANLELAKNRAKAIREELKGAGIAEERAILEKPQETTGSGTDPEARRVEVSIRQ